MKVELNIMGRCTGKTTMAVKKLVEDVRNNILVSNTFFDKFFPEIASTRKDNLVRFREFMTTARLYRGRRVILDDLLHIPVNEHADIYKAIKYFQPREVIIYTSVTKPYSKSLLHFIKEGKKGGVSSWYLLERLLKLGKQFTILEVEELYYNFLTDFDAIINDKHPINVDLLRKHGHRVSLKIRDVEIMNQYLIDDSKKHPELYMPFEHLCVCCNLPHKPEELNQFEGRCQSCHDLPF